MTELLLDAAGRRRTPATMPGTHTGRPPRNKGVRYPTDPPTIEEAVAVMAAPASACTAGAFAVRWSCSGALVPRSDEALSLAGPDLDHRRGSLLVRRGKGG